jgi:hypothetical protein
MPSWATVPQPIVKPIVVEPIVVPAVPAPSCRRRSMSAPVVAARARRSAADVADAPMPSDAAAFASSDVDDAPAGRRRRTGRCDARANCVAAAGPRAERIETEGDSRNPLV